MSEKRRKNIRQVRNRELNASESPWKYRYGEDGVETVVFIETQE